MQWRDHKKWGTTTALMVTFLVSGIWHGVRWGFMVWGGLHGLYLASSVFYRPIQKRIQKSFSLKKAWYLKAWKVAVTFNLVSFAWIFFRARNLDDAWTIIYNIFGFSLHGLTIRYLRNTIGGVITQADIGILLLCTLLMAGISYSRLTANNFERLFSSSKLSRWAFYVVVSLMIIMFSVISDAPFLYFQF